MQAIPHSAASFLLALLLALIPGSSALGANFVVNSADDTDDGLCDAGHCSLREAINAANGPGADLITFALGAATISPGWPLPALTGGGTSIRGDLQIALDGSAQPVGNGLHVQSDGNRIQGLEVRNFPQIGIWVGSDFADQSASNNVIGVDGDTTDDALERNVIRNNGFHGVVIQAPDSTNNVVAGNYIGTNVAGTQARPNGTGVDISFRSHGNLIGTNGDGESDDLERNVISGNDVHGVYIGTGCESNTVAGNYIGFEANGSDPLGNQVAGVFVSFANFNTIGPDNVIGNNGGSGVELGVASFNRVIGNLIGVDVTGTRPSGNLFNGIRIFSGDRASVSNWIGAESASGRFGPRVIPNGNVIAYSAWNGIMVERGADGGGSSDNPFLFNSIYSNELLGIELLPNSCPITACTDGVTPNDSGDTDAGANDVMNYPDLHGASSNGVNTYVLAGISDGLPNATFRVQFFGNSDCDDSGHGEGETFLGQVLTTTNGAGDVSLFATLPVGTTVGDFVTATATESGLFGLFPGSTSEFSACFPIVGANFSLTAEALHFLLQELIDTGMVDARWAAALLGRVNLAVRMQERGNERAARAQLLVFQNFVRILRRRGKLSDEMAQPLLAASRAALQLLDGDPHGPVSHQRHAGSHR